MRIDTWEEGIFLARPNRFVAEVETGGRKELTHLPDPGRLAEMLRPGVEVRLQAADSPRRRTRWTLIGVRCPHGWVNVDSRLPNRLFEEALADGCMREFEGIAGWKREVPFGGSVMDFLLESMPPCLVEVKGCTLVEAGVAFFPDAPTTRGARHLRELIAAKERGLRACIVFVVKHPGARLVRPNRATDPAFARALVEAADRGVEAYAYPAPWRGREIRIEGCLPVELG